MYERTDHALVEGSVGEWEASVEVDDPFYFNRKPIEIEHRNGRTVVFGATGLEGAQHPNGVPTVWLLGPDATPTKEIVIDQYGVQAGNQGIGLGDDGTVIVASGTRAFAVDVDGKLLWSLHRDELPVANGYFGDGLFDADGNAFLGGSVVGGDCNKAMLVRLSW